MAEYFVCLNLLLLSRLLYLRKDEAIGLRWNVGLTAFQLSLLILCFSFTVALWLVLLLLLLVGVLNQLLESRLLKKGWRIYMLLVLVFGIDLLHGLSGGLQLRAALVGAYAALVEVSGLLRANTGVTPEKLLGVLFGLLLLTNEINLFIRMVFRHFGMDPQQQQADRLTAVAATLPLVPSEEMENTHGIDRQEYNTGRVIGILERWLMYLVVLSTNNLAAIGFIIAAKGLARMKQLDDKLFAEYMLIGTLLSMLSAVLIGSWVLQL